MKNYLSNYVLNVSIDIVSKFLLLEFLHLALLFVSYIVVFKITLYSLSYYQKKCNFPFYAILLTFYSDINIVCQPVIL